MVKILKKSEFKTMVEGSDKLVLVDFYATWCGPCKMLAPVIDEIAEEESIATVYKVEVDSLMDIAMKYSVQSVPTLMIFKGGKPVDTLIGYHSKEEIINFINENK